MKIQSLQNNCDCMICKNQHSFQISDDLIADFLKGKVTIFAGAGISTESRNVLKTTFYESVAHELDLKDAKLGFPELMEKFVAKPNGRSKLLQKIKSRFDHIESFPELDRAASRFHTELATFFPVKSIVTTNWDTYFETSCKATPFVTDADLVFWDSADRKVLKIHGSISNYGSLIATASDYEKCKKELFHGIIGSVLKTILATETVVFIGYSLNDTDFNHIYDFVKSQMKGLHKQAYVVTPFIEEGEKFRNIGLIPIVTDGAFFINQIKAHAVSIGAMLSDNIYIAAARLLQLVQNEHEQLYERLNTAKHPQIIYAACYQDGMMHALERIINLRASGEYSHRCRVVNVVKSYLIWQKEKLKHRQYEDVAYIEGYVNALTFLLLEEDERKRVKMPLYFSFGIKRDITSFKVYQSLLKAIPDAHKASFQRASMKIKKLKNPGGIVFHHPPWL